MRETATVERTFRADPQAVYSVYWRLEDWPLVLDGIVEAQCDYDDGVHQRFSMVVAKEGGREAVRGVRIGTPYSNLELCQFTPPPGFRFMRGEWRFTPVPVPGGVHTLVQAQRVFALEDASREEAAAGMLEGLLARNLAAFDAYLTRRAA